MLNSEFIAGLLLPVCCNSKLELLILLSIKTDLCLVMTRLFELFASITLLYSSIFFIYLGSIITQLLCFAIILNFDFLRLPN